MPTFALKVELNNAEALNWAIATDERLKKPHVLKNPFTGFARMQSLDGERYIILKMMPSIYPQLGFIGAAAFVLSVAVAFLLGWWPFYYIAGAIALAGFTQSKYFFYLMSWAALRKAGYIKRPVLLSDEELINLLLE